MKASSVTVFEFGYLGRISAARQDTDIVPISDRAFEYLEKQCLEAALPFLQLCARKSQKVIQVKNYVGVIIAPTGEQIEILPKIGKSQPIQTARQQLLLMLKHLEQFRHIKTKTAAVDTAQLPLLEIFIRQFLESVNHLIKRGLRSDYISQQENIAYQRGKLLVSKQIQHNSIHKHRFYVEHDEYWINRPENRLIHSAMLKIHQYTRSVTNQKLLQEQLFAFADVPFSQNIKRDFECIKIDRSMAYYQPALAWSKLILEGFSPLSMQGNTNAISMLFPMEAVFESYVASILQKQLNTGFTLHTQARSQTLATHQGNGYFRLKPDILIQKTVQSSGKKNHLVLDTKWKLINSAKGNATDKYGLSQADFYQMFAYGHKYLGGSGDVLLIYPAHDGFTQAIENCFDFSADSSQSLKLWVVPFVIGKTDHESRLIFPESITSVFCYRVIANLPEYT
jgi:5-methylcytosine-specific restriction enzyme subunit McrC